MNQLGYILRNNKVVVYITTLNLFQIVQIELIEWRMLLFLINKGFHAEKQL
jgi:hypothetical protein